MKNSKRRLEFFSFYDRTGIQKHLEKMAAKGWLLEKLGGTWKYKAIEPAKLHFAVTYFPDVSEFDPEPPEKMKTFQEFCSQGGWEFLTSSAQMQIFCNRQESPLPIETDASMELESIHRSIKRNVLPSHLVLLLCGVLQLLMLMPQLSRNFVNTLVNPRELMAPICWSMVILLSAVEIGGYYLWRRKAKAAAEADGSFVPSHSHTLLQKLVLILAFLMFALWISSLGRHFAVGILSCLNVLLMILLANGIKKLLKKMGFSAGVNLVVTVIAVFISTIITITGLIYFVGKNRNVFFAERTPVETYEFYGHTQNVYKDPLPLTLEDLGVENVDPKYYNYEKEESGSPFANQVNCRQWARYDAPNGIPSIEYSITTVHAQFLFEKTRKSILASYGRYNRPDTPPEGWGSVLPQDSAPWNADGAWRAHLGGMPRNEFVVCKGNRILEISFHSWEPTPEQMKIVTEKLLR